MNLPVGGIANSILELLPVLERIKNLKITLITKYSEYKPTSNLTTINTFSKFVISKINTIYFFLRFFFRIIKINKKNRIHAIYIPTYYYDSIAPILNCFFFKIPAFIKIPSDFETLQREIFMRYSSSIFFKIAHYGWIRFFRRFVVRKKNVFYQAINEKIYNDLLDLGVSKERILKLPNAISSEKYLEFKKNDHKETHYGYVGRLFKSKNIDFLLKAFVQYLSKYPKDKLYIFGEGSEQKNIKKFIDKRNFSESIILRGFEKDKRKIYSTIDVLIHPSFGEGSPNIILESSITNTFVIASNVIGIRDIVSHRKSGLLFNPFKEKDLLKQLIYYKQHQDLIPNILEYANNKIIDNYDVNVIGNKIYDFIKSKWMYKPKKGFLKISIITLAFPHPRRGILPGVENYVESFAVPLKKLGYEVKIITTFWNGSKKFDNYKGIPIIRFLDSKTLLGKLGSVFHLNNITFGLNLLLKRNFKYYCDSDIIIIPLAIGFTSFFKLKKIPVVSAFFHYDLKNSFIDYITLPFYHLLENRELKKHKNILTISNSSKKDITNFYGIDKKYIKVIPIGVDTDKFNPSKFTKEIRKKYGENILFCVGPFLKRKRIPVLLEAMKYVIKEIPDIHLILAGKGLLWDYCKKLSFKLGINQYTTFVGFVEQEDLSKYFASSDLFVFPSELEGFGQVILESMASGTPVICANKSPMNKIIENGGITFEVNDSEDLSLKIIDLLKNKEKLIDLKKKSLRIAKKYDLCKIGVQYIKYFKQIYNK